MTARTERLKAERLLDALGDPTRRALIHGLCKRPSTVSDLAQALNITLTAVGQHLNVLEECRLVATRKVGRVRTCSFEPEGLNTLEAWIAHHRATWEQNLDRLGAFLAEDDDT